MADYQCLDFYCLILWYLSCFFHVFSQVNLVFFYFLFPPSPHWFGKCMFIQFYSFSKILLCIRALTKSRAVTSFFSTIRLLLPSPLLILGAFVVWYYGSIFFFFFLISDLLSLLLSFYANIACSYLLQYLPIPLFTFSSCIFFVGLISFFLKYLL